MSFSAAARSMLDHMGQDATFRREGEDDLAIRAVVSDYGLCPAPSNWPGEYFQGHARHAAFRLHPEDMPVVDGSAIRPQANDTIIWDGRRYTVRFCLPEPSVYGSSGPMWWVCMAKSDQRSQA